jgi:S-adenosylmethionine hydrolase
MAKTLLTKPVLANDLRRGDVVVMDEFGPWWTTARVACVDHAYMDCPNLPQMICVEFAGNDSFEMYAADTYFKVVV